MTKSHSPDFDLNLAPIIDCFTVLITFMLVSASFLSIGILEAGAGASSQGAVSTPPDVILEVQMLENFRIEMKLSGKESRKIALGSLNGTWDFSGLAREISGVQKKWPKADSVILSAANDVEYLHIIQCMEKVHQMVPTVLLGGF